MTQSTALFTVLLTVLLAVLVAPKTTASAAAGGSDTLWWGQGQAFLHLKLKGPTLAAALASSPSPSSADDVTIRLDEWSERLRVVTAVGSEETLLLDVTLREPVYDAEEGRHRCYIHAPATLICKLEKTPPHFHDALLAPPPPAQATYPPDLTVRINWDLWEEPDDADLDVLDAYRSTKSGGSFTELTDASVTDFVSAHNLVVIDVSYPWCEICKRLRSATLAAARHFASSSAAGKGKGQSPVFAFADARDNVGLRHAYDSACLGGSGCALSILKAGEPVATYRPVEPIVPASVVAEIAAYMGPLVRPLDVNDNGGDALERALDEAAAQGLGVVLVEIDASSPASAAEGTVLAELVANVSALYRRHWSLYQTTKLDLDGDAARVSVFPKPSAFDDAAPGGTTASLVVSRTAAELEGVDVEAFLVSAVQPVLQMYSWTLREQASLLDFPVAVVWFNVSSPEALGSASEADDPRGSSPELLAHARDFVADAAVPLRAAGVVLLYTDAGQAFMLRDYNLDPEADLPAVGYRSQFRDIDAVLYGAPLTGERAEWPTRVRAFVADAQAGRLARAFRSRALEPAELEQNKDPTRPRVLNQDLLVDALAQLADPHAPLQEIVVLFYRGWQKQVEYARGIIRRIAAALARDGTLVDALVLGSYDGADNAYDTNLFLHLDDCGDAPVLYLVTHAPESPSGFDVQLLKGSETKLYARTLWSWLKTHSELIAGRWPELVAVRRAIVDEANAAAVAIKAAIETAPHIALAEPNTPSGPAPYKQVLVDGDGHVPSEGDKLGIRYELRLADGSDTLVERVASHDTDEPLKVELGQGQTVYCLDLALATMQVGERAYVVCPPDWAYGSRGSPDARVPPNTPIAFDVTVATWRPRTVAHAHGHDEL